jgi:general secretion pathway protein L
VIFEPSTDEIISRRMTVPARARELLPGIVRNQIERVSPWRASQAAFGFDARASEDPANLDIRILIMPRAQLDDALARIGALGLQADAVMVGDGSSETAAGVTLWSRLGDASSAHMLRVRRAVAGLIIATVCLSVVVSGWAFWSAASASAESDDIDVQLAALQRQIRGSHSPQAIAALPPPERAWALKESSLVAAVAIEALSRVLPDNAYLTELNIDGTTVRMVGIAQDAPALIAPLEQSGHFKDVHFYAPTTRNADGVRFIFHIEAQAEPHTTISGG